LKQSVITLLSFFSLLLLSACSKAPSGSGMEPAAGPELQGRVTTTQGQPVADAVVELYLQQAGSADPVRVRSAADGAYAFEGLETGTYNLTAASGSLAGILRNISMPTDGSGAGLTLIMAQSGSISGRALQESASPEAPGLAGVPGVSVSIPGTGYRAETAADGSFHLPGIPAALHDLLFDSPAHHSAVHQGVSVSAGQNAVLPAVTLQPLATPGEPAGPDPEEPEPEAPGLPGFRIDLLFSGSGLTPGHADAFREAADRWGRVITSDLPAVRVRKPAGACGTSETYSGVVDDLLIQVVIEPIDGPGGILGSAGPCFLRSAEQGGLPAFGVIRLDSADLSGLQARGQLVGTILHEMGHVLGIGTLWPSRNLLDHAGNQAACDRSTSFSRPPVFTGETAGREYATLGGSGQVPVEDGYGPGTKCGHWREATFGSELMTGIIASSSTPLSRMTIASLGDLGYLVDPEWSDPYRLPACSPACPRPLGVTDFQEILLFPEAAPPGSVVPVD
jgi:hypothetical protein